MPEGVCATMITEFERRLFEEHKQRQRRLLMRPRSPSIVPVPAPPPPPPPMPEPLPEISPDFSFELKINKIRVPDIQRFVAKVYDVKKSDMISPSRLAHITWPRQIAMYLCREVIKISYPHIGERFGGRDHTTVLHAANKVRKKMQEDDAFRDHIEALKEEITKHHDS